MVSNQTLPFPRFASLALALTCAYSIVVFWSWATIEGDRRFLTFALAGPLIWLSIVDARSYMIPDTATFLVAGIGAVQLLSSSTGFELALEFVAAVLVFWTFWTLGEICWRQSGREALGAGDAKLMAAGTLCVGISQFWLVLLLAAVGGIVTILISGRNQLSKRQGIAFGPFLAFAIFLVFVGGLA